LAHTPPRPEIQLGQEYGAGEAELSTSGRGREGFESIGRRRPINWLDDGSPTRRLGGRIKGRVSQSTERRWVTDSSLNVNGQRETGLD
jgi:hypothetical protein